MKNHHLNIILSFSLLVFLSCIGEPTPVQETSPLTQYPLSIGNSWEYQRIAQFTNFRPDSIRNRVRDTLDFTRINVTIPGMKELQSNKTAFILQEKSMISPVTGIGSESYYTQDSYGLYLDAQMGKSIVLPKNANTKIRFMELHFRDINGLLTKLHIPQHVTAATSSDSIKLYNPPLKVLLYPLAPGKLWLYRAGDIPFQITKKIDNRETVTIRAGNFTADVVRLLYDLDNDGVWDPEIDIRDYYSSPGLIKRSILIRDLVVTDMNLNDLGLVDFSEVSELINYDIQ